MTDPVIPESVAYTIMSGYYPEIASRVQYGGKKKGKGRVGAKRIKKRGFSNTSVVREEYSMMDEFTKAAVAFGKDSMVPGTAGLGYLKQYGFDAKTEKYKYKFMGGSDKYSLYGDQVWYMAGIRDKKDMVTQFLQDSNMSAVQYQQAYKDAEPEMVREAVNFAKEVFDKAYDTAKIQEHIDGLAVDAAEEIGFKDGEYEWMTVDEAVKRKHVSAKSGFSKANERDMVKYNAKTGEVEATFDVTEQSIMQHGQHGVIKPPQELVDAIKDIEAGDKAPDKQALKQQVIKMYTKNLNYYNNMITGLKKKVGFDNAKKRKGNKGLSNVDILLKEVGGGKGKKADTKKIASQLNVKMGKFHFLDTAEKSARQTGVEFLAHMLGTLNVETNTKFAQTHRVADLPNGRKIYASVPIQMSWKTLLFLKGPLAQTAIVEGHSATTALHYNQTNTGFEKGKSTVRSQKHAYTRSKIGKAAIGSNQHRTVATAMTNLRKGVLPATAVSIPAGDKLQKKLNDLLQGIGTAGLSIKKLGSSADKLAKRSYGIRGRKLQRGKGNMAEAGFWALPYIGVLQSEFEKEKSKK
jgi:hypothetical protein